MWLCCAGAGEAHVWLACPLAPASIRSLCGGHSVRCGTPAPLPRLRKGLFSQPFSSPRLRRPVGELEFDDDDDQSWALRGVSPAGTRKSRLFIVFSLGSSRLPQSRQTAEVSVVCEYRTYASARPTTPSFLYSIAETARHVRTLIRPSPGGVFGEHGEDKVMACGALTIRLSFCLPYNNESTQWSAAARQRHDGQ